MIVEILGDYIFRARLFRCEVQVTRADILLAMFGRELYWSWR